MIGPVPGWPAVVAGPRRSQNSYPPDAISPRTRLTIQEKRFRQHAPNESLFHNFREFLVAANILILIVEVTFILI
jgi:hypothetical protein